MPVEYGVGHTVVGGVTSIRERAEELGGTLEAGYADSGGRVVAMLPLSWAG